MIWADAVLGAASIGTDSIGTLRSAKSSRVWPKGSGTGLYYLVLWAARPRGPLHASDRAEQGDAAGRRVSSRGLRSSPDLAVCGQSAPQGRPCARLRAPRRC